MKMDLGNATVWKAVNLLYEMNQGKDAGITAQGEKAIIERHG